MPYNITPYKENKYFKKHCGRHKDIKKILTYLENICNDENCDFYVFGSILRNDFYYKQSDCDLIIACDDIDKTIAKFEYIIQNNKNIQLIDSISKRLYAVQNMPQLKNSCASALLLKINMNGLPIDINFLKKNDFTMPGSSNIQQSNNYLYIVLISIIKFFYYKIHIVPDWLYAKMKIFINHNFSSRRYTLVKEI